jgi:ArsR family transcriptional regulator
VLNASTELDEIQASMLRALASGHRLRILHALGERPREVSELAIALALPPTALSQHLAALRAVGLVESSRDGRFVRYRLADPDILAACSTMRAVIVRRLSSLGDLAATVSAADPGATAPVTAVATASAAASATASATSDRPHHMESPAR